VGRFLDLVRERGEVDDTVVVYASDHGEMLGDHGRWGKSTWYTPAVGVPLIASGPGVRSGVVSDALVSLHDLSATFIDYAQAPAMPETDALSLRPLLLGHVETHRDCVISGLADWRLIYDGQHKLISERGEPDTLYDVSEDPWEDRDVAGERPDTARQLRDLLARELPDWVT